MTNDNLSEHDKEILIQIREIDNEYKWTRWLDIAVLANELEDKKEKEYWHRICSRYNHIEEYYAGCL